MLKILIVDDHAVVRRGLKQILSEEIDELMFCEASTAKEAIKSIKEQEWDIVILDISLPDQNGIETLKEMKRIRQTIPALVLSIHPEEQFAVRVLKAGAAGYMTKNTAPEELVKAVRKVIEGGKYISPSLAEKLADDLVTDSDRPLYEILSDREYQVMHRLAIGKTVTAIAKELYLSVKTISTYRGRILTKMKMKTNADLIQYAIKNQLVG